MAKKPDTPCVGCGKLLWSGPRSKPAGERLCVACRADRRAAARVAAAAKKRRVQPRRPPPRRFRVTCAGCEGEFIPYRATDRFCSSTCKYRVRPHTCHRERARHFGVPYETVVASKIYERDGWRCGICRKAVDRSRKFPDLLSPSLDHVVPLSEPGSPGHVRRNVQLAHLGCNIQKGSGVVDGGEQLALIG